MKPRGIDYLIAVMPLIGVYFVVVLYHLSSSFFSGSVVEQLYGAHAKCLTGGATLFMGALLLSTIAWFGAIAYFLICGYAGLEWLDRRSIILIMAVIALWSVGQPWYTTMRFPQAMSLLVAQTDDVRTQTFISIFKHSRLPGFTLGLCVVFVMCISLVAVARAQDVRVVARIRKRLSIGFVIFVGLAFLGLVRLATAQRSVEFVLPSGAPPSELFNELAVHTAYYAMMATLACLGACISFNLLVRNIQNRGQLFVNSEPVHRVASDTEIEDLLFGNSKQLKVVATTLIAPAIPLIVDRLVAMLLRA